MPLGDGFDSVLEFADEDGYHILACGCESRHWIVLVSKDAKQQDGLRLYCPLCNSLSGKLLPSRPEDRRLLIEAGRDMNAQDKEKKKTEQDWGDMVSEVDTNSGYKN